MQVDHIFADESKVSFQFDYLETGPGGGTGTWASVAEPGLNALQKVLEENRSGRPGPIPRASAIALPYRDNSVHAVVTDPPYYNMIDYSDASDGDCDQPAPQGGDHRLAAADPVPFHQLAAQDEPGELVQPGRDRGGDQRRPHPRGVDLFMAGGQVRSAAPCLLSRKMFSMLVRCLYQCSTAAALAAVDTSRLVQMKL